MTTKLAYSPPVLVRLGKVSDLTRAGGTMTNDGGGAMTQA